MAQNIDEKTKVPLFAVLITVPALAGAMLWMSMMYATAVNAERTNDRQDVEIQKQTDLLQDIRSVVIRIEERQKQRGR